MRKFVLIIAVLVSLIATGTASAQAPPTATTGAATGITMSEATLNGTVNAYGADTTVTFEYGLDAAYGTTVTADQSRHPVRACISYLALAAFFAADFSRFARSAASTFCSMMLR